MSCKIWLSLEAQRWHAGETAKLLEREAKLERREHQYNPTAHEMLTGSKVKTYEGS